MEEKDKSILDMLLSNKHQEQLTSYTITRKSRLSGTPFVLIKGDVVYFDEENDRLIIKYESIKRK